MAPNVVARRIAAAAELQLLLLIMTQMFIKIEYHSFNLVSLHAILDLYLKYNRVSPKSSFLVARKETVSVTSI